MDSAFGRSSAISRSSRRAIRRRLITSPKKPQTTSRLASASGIPRDAGRTAAGRRSGPWRWHGRRRRSRRSRSPGWAPNRRGRRRTGAGCGSISNVGADSRVGRMQHVADPHGVGPPGPAARSCSCTVDGSSVRHVVDEQPAVPGAGRRRAKQTPTSSSVDRPARGSERSGTVRTSSPPRATIHVPVAWHPGRARCRVRRSTCDRHRRSQSLIDDQLQRGTVAEHDLDVRRRPRPMPGWSSTTVACGVRSMSTTCMDIGRSAHTDPLQARSAQRTSAVSLHADHVRPWERAPHGEGADPVRGTSAAPTRNGAIDGVDVTSTCAASRNRGRRAVDHAIGHEQLAAGESRRSGVNRHASSRPRRQLERLLGHVRCNRSRGSRWAAARGMGQGVGEGHLNRQLLPSAAR